MNELDKFVQISKYAGERFDLIQAGGGNSSVKISDSKMLIKTSGCILSSIDKDFGYVEVNQKKILAMIKDKSFLDISNKKLKEEKSSQLVRLAQYDETKRSSIEIGEKSWEKNLLLWFFVVVFWIGGIYGKFAYYPLRWSEAFFTKNLQRSLKISLQS